MPSREQRLRALKRARKFGDKALEVFTLEAMAREGYPEVVEAPPKPAPEPPMTQSGRDF